MARIRKPSGMKALSLLAASLGAGEDLDPRVILRLIAVDEKQPGGVRVMACRSLLAYPASEAGVRTRGMSINELAVLEMDREEFLN
jgi:hypothetical protein